jgi:hypothetical protein
MSASTPLKPDTAQLNDVDALAWMTDVPERIVSERTKRHALGTPLPSTCKAANSVATQDTTWRLRSILRQVCRATGHRPRKSPG